MSLPASKSENRTVFSNKIIEIDKTNAIDIIMVVVMTAFLSITPFFRGLYFRENYIPSVLVLGILFFAFFAYKFVKKDYTIISSWLDVAVLLLPISYLLSFFSAVSYKWAFDAIFKYSGYFMIFILASRISRTRQIKRLMLDGAILSILVTTFVGLLNACGYIDLMGVMEGNRFYGIYQYANTTASVIAVGLVAVIGLYINSRSMVAKVYYQLINITFFVAVIITLSRGAFMILALVIAVYFFTVDASKKIYMMECLVITFLSGSPFISYYYNVGNVKPAFYFYLLALVLAGILVFAVDFINERIMNSINERKINLAVIGLAVAVAAAGMFIYFSRTPIELKISNTGENSNTAYSQLIFDGVKQGEKYKLNFIVDSDKYSANAVSIQANYSAYQDSTAFKTTAFDLQNGKNEKLSFDFEVPAKANSITFRFENDLQQSSMILKDISITDENGKVVKKYEKLKYLPESVGSRLLDISLKTQNARYRLAYMRDGMNIIKDHLLVGTGGGGWQSLYMAYQRFPYVSNEAHSFYIQHLVETGLFGGLALLVFLIIFVRGFIVALLKKKDALNICIYFSIIMLLLHSTLDFNLSAVAVSFLLWYMVGLVSDDSVELGKMSKAQPYILASQLLCSLLIAYFCFSIYSGIRVGHQASKLLNADADKAMPLYEEAMRKDIYCASYRADYVQIIYSKFLETKDRTYINKIDDLVDEILKCEPYNTKYQLLNIRMLLSGTNRMDQVLTITRDMVRMKPMYTDAYLAKVSVENQVAEYFLKKGQRAKALPFLKSIVETEQKYKAAAERSEAILLMPDQANQIIAVAKQELAKQQ